MKTIHLTKEEKAIEAALLKGEYVPVCASEHKAVARALAARKLFAAKRNRKRE